MSAQNRTGSHKKVVKVKIVKIDDAKVNNVRTDNVKAGEVKTNNVKVDKSSDSKLFTKEDMLTLPNLLTALRILLAPFFILTLLNGRYILALILLIVAALTDFFDGLIARKFNMRSEFGRLLDPIADKVLIFSVAIVLLFKFGFPFWLFMIIISRDILIVLAGIIFILLNKRSELKPNLAGKISTGFQMSSLTIYAVSAIVGYYSFWIGILLYMTAAMTLLSGIIYAVEGYKMLKRKS